METLGRVNLLTVPFTSALLDIRNWTNKVLALLAMKSP